MTYIEKNENRVARLIILGTWLYDNMVCKPVKIFALNYDFYFELDEEYYEDGKQPELNNQGEQYVVVWNDEPFFAVSDFPSNGFMTLNDTKIYAESIVQKIEWNEPVTNNYV